MRANARKYGVNPGHLGAYGFSSGAHLALLLGLTRPSDGLEGSDDNQAFSSRVQAVVSSAGPTDLAGFSPSAQEMLGPLLGGTEREVPRAYEAASPSTYVRPDSPPVLMPAVSLIGQRFQGRRLGQVRSRDE